MQAKAGAASARILSIEEVRERLGELWDVLSDLPARAFAAYKKHVASQLSQPSGRIRAAAIHEFMVDELRRLMTARMAKLRGRWVLAAAEDLVIQFKKVDGRGRTSNVPTRAALEWETQLHLEDMPPAMRVTLGYQLTKDETELADVCLVARDGDRLIWRESLTSQGDLFEPIAKPITRTPPKLRAKREALEARGVPEKSERTEKPDQSGE